MKGAIAFILTIFTSLLYAQQQGNLHVVGDELTVPAGNNLYILGDYQDHTGTTLFNGQPAMGSLSNGDTIYVGRDIINHSSNGLNISDEGTITLDGDTIQIISGKEQIDFHNLFIDGDTITLYQVIAVTDSLQLIRGRINNDSVISGIDLGNFGALFGENSTNYIYGDLGKIYLKNRALSGSKEDIAGAGLSIEVNGSLGTSTIERQNGQHAGAADGSIYRFYNIIPGTSGEITSAKIKYLDHEVGNIPVDSMTFWQSNNAGVVWNKQTTSRFPSLDEVLGKSLKINGQPTLMTLADSLCDNLPIVNLGADKAICEGTAVTLDAKNPGLFFLWNTGATSQKIETNVAGTYWVLVTDANGCAGVDSIKLETKKYPVVDFQQDYKCYGQVSTFTNTSTIDEGGLTYKWDFGDVSLKNDTSILQSPIYNFQKEGQYQVKLTATSDFNCTAEKTRTYVVHPLPKPSFSVQDVCEGVSSQLNNTSTVLSSIGLVTYAISAQNWDFGVASVSDDVSTLANPTYTYLQYGNFNIKLVLETNAGCKDSITQATVINPLPNAQFSGSNVCFGSDIALANQSSVPSGSLSYKWDFGDGKVSTAAEPDKSYDNYGEYSIKLSATTAKGCKDSTTAVVKAYDFPEPNFSVTNVCAGNDIAIVNTTSIRTSDELTYTWTFGDGAVSTDKNPLKTYDNPGKYTIKLEVSSQFGCSKSIEKVVTVHPNPVADFNSESVCFGTATRFSNVSTIKSGFLTYSWDFGNGQTSKAKNPSHTYVKDGTYDVVLKVISANGCEAMVTRKVTVYPSPIIDLQTEISTCADSYLLDAGNTGSKFLWSDNSTNQTFKVIQSGSYRVVVTSANGCSYEKTVNVILNSVFEPNLIDEVTACNSTILDAGNAGAQSYLWSTGASTRTLEVTTSGIYKVDIVDKNGCPGSQEINVTINNSPVFDLGTDQSICEGEKLLLDATINGATYAWSTGSTQPTLEVDQSGTYKVTVTGQDGCVATDEIKLTVNPKPIIDLGEDRNECGAVTLSGPDGASVYIWNDGSHEQKKTFDQSGEYILSIQTSEGCKSSDTVNIIIDPLPVVSLPEKALICSGERVRLEAGNEQNTIIWSTKETTSAIEVTATGLYSVVVTNSLGCKSSDTTLVDVQPKVEVNLGENKTICVGNSAVFDAGIFPTGSTYGWSGVAQGQLGTEKRQEANVQDTYVIEVTTPLGCVGRDSVNLNVALDTLLADFLMVSSANVFDSIQFINISIPDSLNYLWKFGDGNRSTNEDEQHIYLKPGVFQVNLLVFNDFCESSITKAITIIDPSQGRTEGPENTDELESLIEKPHLIDQLKTYPNPTRGVFTLDLVLSSTGSVELMLADLSGQIIVRETFENLESLNKQFNITNYATGIYLLRVMTKDQTKTLRILKNQ